MFKSSKHIEIVRTTIGKLSSMSQASCDSLFAVLDKHFAKVGVTVVNNLSDLEALVAAQPDLVFLGMAFIPAEPALGLADPNKIWLSDFLDLHGIAYTGSTQVAHQFERNKPLAKQRILEVGLKTPAFCVAEQNQPQPKNALDLTFPLFVKPTNRGGGLGINSNSVVYNAEQLNLQIHSITNELQSDSLIEEYLPGREFSVAILKNEYSADFSAMPIELIAPTDSRGIRLLSGAIKSSNAEQAVEVTDRIIKSKVTALALSAFSALGARDYGRIDIRLDNNGTPHFLEANLIPSLISGYGSFPKACVLNMSLEYEPMIITIARLGLARNIKDNALAEPVAVSNPVFPSTTLEFEPV